MKGWGKGRGLVKGRCLRKGSPMRIHILRLTRGQWGVVWARRHGFCWGEPTGSLEGGCVTASK